MPTGKNNELAGVHIRVGNLIAALAGAFDGEVSWEDADLWVVTVPAMVASRDADSALRILLFRTPQPSELAALAGTERVAEGAWQVDGEELTGRQTVTMRARARVDQNAVRQLLVGEADLIVRGLAKRVRIIRTRVPGSVETVARGLTRPRPAGSLPGNPAPNRDRPGRSPLGYQVRRQRLKPGAGPPGRLLPSLTLRRRPRSGGTGRRGLGGEASPGSDRGGGEAIEEP